jgi:hypothetical protein
MKMAWSCACVISRPPVPVVKFVSVACLAKRQPARVDTAVADCVSQRSALVLDGFAQSCVLLDKALHVPLPELSHVTHAYVASTPNANTMPSIRDKNG